MDKIKRLATKHPFYILGEPLPVVLLHIVVAFFLGILFGALVLRGSSIYPAAVFHGLLNLSGYLNLTGNATQGTPASWLMLSLWMIPLAAYGVYLLRDTGQSLIHLNSLLENKYPKR